MVSATAYLVRLVQRDNAAISVSTFKEYVHNDIEQRAGIALVDERTTQINNGKSTVSEFHAVLSVSTFCFFRSGEEGGTPLTVACPLCGFRENSQSSGIEDLSMSKNDLRRRRRISRRAESRVDLIVHK